MIGEALESTEFPHKNRPTSHVHDIAIRRIPNEKMSNVLPSYSYEELAQLQEEDEDLKAILGKRCRCHLLVFISQSIFSEMTVKINH